jgi:hypothetical protein
MVRSKQYQVLLGLIVMGFEFIETSFKQPDYNLTIEEINELKNRYNLHKKHWLLQKELKKFVIGEFTIWALNENSAIRKIEYTKQKLNEIKNKEK